MLNHSLTPRISVGLCCSRYRGLPSSLRTSQLVGLPSLTVTPQWGVQIMTLVVA